MPYCPVCGQSVRLGARFCSNCGARLNLQNSEPVRDTGERAGFVECPKCHGTGRVPCPKCDGTQKVEISAIEPLTGRRVYKTVPCDCRDGTIKCRYPGCVDGFIRQ
jgi:hypothetical protein